MNSFTVVLALLVFAKLSGSQHVEPLELCANTTVSVAPGLGGVIQHTTSDPPSSCILTLTGLTEGAHISFPGVDGNCGINPVSLIIGDKKYCVLGEKSTNVIIVEVKETELLISTHSNSNFSIEFYTNVGTCGQNISIPSSAKSNQLSGVISSNIDPTLEIRDLDCFIKIQQLPNGSVYMVFEFLFKSLNNRLWYINNGHENFSIDELVSTREQHITFHSLNEDERRYGFVIRYTILSCGATPNIIHSKQPDSVKAWIPGDVVEYKCEVGYQLSITPATIECLVHGRKASWSNSSHISCHRVSCPTNNMTNNTSEVKYYQDKMYHKGENGYEKNIKCESNGVWSTPDCDGAVSDDSMLTAIICVTVGGIVAVGLMVVASICVFRHLSKRKHRRAKNVQRTEPGDCSSATYEVDSADMHLYQNTSQRGSIYKDGEDNLSLECELYEPVNGQVEPHVYETMVKN